MIVPNALAELVSAEGMRLAKNVNGLQQTGLAGTIIADNQVEPRIKIKGGTAQISKISQAQLTDRHGNPGSAYNRIGMTTYKLDSSWLSLMMALLFESFSLICTVSDPSTLSTSIR